MRYGDGVAVGNRIKGDSLTSNRTSLLANVSAKTFQDLGIANGPLSGARLTDAILQFRMNLKEECKARGVNPDNLAFNTSDARERAKTMTTTPRKPSPSPSPRPAAAPKNPSPEPAPHPTPRRQSEPATGKRASHVRSSYRSTPKATLATEKFSPGVQLTRTDAAAKLVMLRAVQADPHLAPVLPLHGNPARTLVDALRDPKTSKRCESAINKAAMDLAKAGPEFRTHLRELGNAMNVMRASTEVDLKGLNKTNKDLSQDQNRTADLSL
jgi:hypothetical protein